MEKNTVELADDVSGESKDRKRVVLFVGSFVRETDDGRNGGQMFACNTLIDSRISDDVEWILVDSTAPSPPHPVGIRALIALKRVFKCSYYLLTRRIDTTLVFTSHGVSFMEKGLVILLSSLRGRKSIIAPRSGLIIDDFNKPLMRRYIRLVMRRASLVVCQSSYWQNQFQQITSDARCVVIHNWIDFEAYPQVNKFPAPDAPVRLMFLGWVTKDKGVYELFDAVRQLSQRYNIKLCVCGNGDAFNELSKRIEEFDLQNVIELKGWVKHDEKLLEFGRADIFVHPTHYEGFPNSLLEAMSSGVPIVCSDIPPITSLVENRKSSIHFRVRDADSLALALEELIVNPQLRKDLARSARELVESKFSVSYGVNSLEKIL